MLFDELLIYCYDKCLRKPRTKCVPCTHDHNVCPRSCMTCLDQTHWTNRINRRTEYNCEHIINHYVCHFLNRYTSEILYALS